MLKHFLFALFLGFLILFAYWYWYTGYYKTVEVRYQQSEPLVLVGVEHFGFYHEIAKKIAQVEAFVQAQGGDCHQSFGWYKDDPRKVEGPRLRSMGGCVLPQPLSVGELATWQQAWKEKVLAKAPDLGPLLQIFWPQQAVVTAYFEGAPGISPLKVYPAAWDYAQQAQLQLSDAVLEKYVRKGDHLVTWYYFPVTP